MLLKYLALFLVLDICLASLVEEEKVPVPITAGPPIVTGHSSKPENPDNEDLKADPSTWWHTYYHQTYPVYYYNVHSVPAYVYSPPTYVQVHY